MKNKRKAILLVGALLCLNLNIFSQNIPLKMNKVWVSGFSRLVSFLLSV